MAAAKPKCSRIVGVKQTDNIVSFLIQDDGKGFDLEKIVERTVTERSLGLAAMDERTRMLGGQLEVSSQEGKGTKIAFKIPVSIRRQA